MIPEHEGFPAPIYAETVLSINFSDAQRYFLDSLFDLHAAHALMLRRQGIITSHAAAAIFEALENVDRERLRTMAYDGTAEDLFFYIQREIEQRAGEDAGGRLHTARSRNDIGLTLYRMVLRKRILKIADAQLELCRAAVALSNQHIGTIMPAYTHTQPAQPTTVAHYLLGMIECFIRDLGRLQAAFVTVNRSPLGACAITTTGFPIDRQYTAALLGFEGLQENSFGAIAATDYVTETAGVIATVAVNVGKFVQDLLLWCNPALGFFRLPDRWIQISSIMPQKRNPVALEHVRILSSRVLAQAQGVYTCAHNTPFGDIVDSEDDLQPQVLGTADEAVRTLRLLTGILRDCELNTERMKQRAEDDFLTVTELADSLVRAGGLSFHQAHAIVSESVTRQNGHYSRDETIRLVREIARERTGAELRVSLADLKLALDVQHFIDIRRIEGGPAATTTINALKRTEQELILAATWTEAKETLLSGTAHRIETAGRELASYLTNERTGSIDA